MEVTVWDPPESSYLDLASASQCGQAMSMARRHDMVRVAVRDAPCARARYYLGSRLWYQDIDPDKMTGRARAGARCPPGSKIKLDQAATRE